MPVAASPSSSVPRPRGLYTALLYDDPLGGGDVQALLEGMAESGCRRVFGGATGQHIPWFGIYAWGEAAPIGEVTHFHNFAFSAVHPHGLRRAV